MDIFERLQCSKFRKKFCLKDKDIAYVKKRGLNGMRDDAYHFVLKRIAPCQPRNDGRQTPMRNHPVFIAQHATATCCRSCISKWHGIEKGKKLSEKEIETLVSLILEWIQKQLECHEKDI